MGTEEENSAHGVGRTNTRRHIRSSPSTGSAVTTVIEADEDDTDSVLRKVKELQISTPETVAEEPEVAEVPVIVEHSMVPQPTDDHKSQRPNDADVSDADQTIIEIEPVQPESDDAQKPSSDEKPSTEGVEKPDGDFATSQTDTPANPSESAPPTQADELSTQAEGTATEPGSKTEEGVEPTPDAETKGPSDTDKKD